MKAKPRAERVCTICKGEGWVCENHPDLPWQHDGCGGAGDPCCCNPDGKVKWALIYADVDADYLNN